MWVHRTSRATTPRDAGTRPSVGQIGFSRALRPSADAPHRPSCRATSKSQSVPSNRFHQGKTCSGAAHTPSLTAGLGHVCLMCSLFVLFLFSVDMAHSDRSAAPSPLTLAGLATQGHGVWVWCHRCARGRRLAVASLIRRLGGEFPVPDLKHRLRCRHCGLRDVDARPDWPQRGVITSHKWNK